MQIIKDEPKRPDITIKFTAHEADCLRTIVVNIGGSGPLNTFATNLFLLLSEDTEYLEGLYKGTWVAKDRE